MAKIKIEKELYQRAEESAQEAGYSSVDELVSHLIERFLREQRTRAGGGEADQGAVEERLKGLGYID